MESLFYRQRFSFLHAKSFPLPLFNPSFLYFTPIFKKDDVRLGCFVPSFHPGTHFYSRVSLRKVYDKTLIILPRFHFLLSPSAFFLTSIFSEFDVTNIICVLKPKKIILKAFEDLLIILSSRIPWEKTNCRVYYYFLISDFSVHTIRKPFKIFVGRYHLLWWMAFIISTLLVTGHLLFAHSFLRVQINLALFVLAQWRI